MEGNSLSMMGKGSEGKEQSVRVLFNVRHVLKSATLSPLRVTCSGAVRRL